MCTLDGDFWSAQLDRCVGRYWPAVKAWGAVESRASALERAVEIRCLLRRTWLPTSGTTP